MFLTTKNFTLVVSLKVSLQRFSQIGFPGQLLGEIEE